MRDVYSREKHGKPGIVRDFFYLWKNQGFVIKLYWAQGIFLKILPLNYNFAFILKADGNPSMYNIL